MRADVESTMQELYRDKVSLLRDVREYEQSLGDRAAITTRHLQHLAAVEEEVRRAVAAEAARLRDDSLSARLAALSIDDCLISSSTTLSLRAEDESLSEAMAQLSAALRGLPLSPLPAPAPPLHKTLAKIRALAHRQFLIRQLVCVKERGRERSERERERSEREGRTERRGTE